jgi:hypothetical protein
MQNNIDRAKQFLPFDALEGYRNMLSNSDKLRTRDKLKYLDEDYNNELNRILNKLDINFLVKIKYYNGDNYIETNGRIKKIDLIRRKIYLSRSYIDIDNIIDIEIIDD